MPVRRQENYVPLVIELLLMLVQSHMRHWSPAAFPFFFPSLITALCHFEDTFIKSCQLLSVLFNKWKISAFLLSSLHSQLLKLWVTTQIFHNYATTIQQFKFISMYVMKQIKYPSLAHCSLTVALSQMASQFVT